MSHAQEAANTALSRVKEHFNNKFNRDPAGMPRSWTNPKTNIPAIAADARQAAGQLLSHLAVARISRGGVGGRGGRADIVEVAVMQQLVEGKSVAPGGAWSSGAFDLLSAREWPASVAPADVLMSPAAVCSTWCRFLSDSMLTVQQAMETQKTPTQESSSCSCICFIILLIVLFMWMFEW